MGLTLKDKLEKEAATYYGSEIKIAQMYQDPKVRGCKVCRVEDDTYGNWCFVINLDFGDSIDEQMIEDYIELNPGQKISKKMFGDLKFF